MNFAPRSHRCSRISRSGPRDISFNHKIVSVSKFALASFVDEAVLTNNFPLRAEWERNPLQLEYFGEALAGNKFFDKLESMLQQIDVTQDAVEIYYFCMLLGFKGRYGVYEQDKLLAIMQTTANALVKAGKIKQVELSPHWLVNDQPEPPKKRGMPIVGKDRSCRRSRARYLLSYLVMFLMSANYLQSTVDRFTDLIVCSIDL